MAVGDTVLSNSFPTTVTIAVVTGTFKFNIKGVTPPGWSGRGGNETTHMGSTVVTQLPKKLDVWADSTFRIASSVNGVYQQLYAARRLNGLVTFAFPDPGDGVRNLNIWGWVESCVWQEFTTDDPEPQANCTFKWSHKNATLVDTLPYLT